MNLTAEVVRDFFSYDAETGLFRWRKPHKGCVAGSIAGGIAPNGYWYIRLDRKLRLAHRLAWLWVHGYWPINQIDHINGNPADNRLCNLREASETQNKANRPAQKNNTSGFKGVSWYAPGNKWRAAISAYGKYHSLGYFDDPIKAHAAYAAAALRLFGEFARAS